MKGILVIIFLIITTLVLIGLKVFDVLELSWTVATFPIWGATLFLIICVAEVKFVVGFVSYCKKLNKRLVGKDARTNDEKERDVLFEKNYRSYKKLFFRKKKKKRKGINL